MGKRDIIWVKPREDNVLAANTPFGKEIDLGLRPGEAAMIVSVYIPHLVGVSELALTVDPEKITEDIRTQRVRADRDIILTADVNTAEQMIHFSDPGIKVARNLGVMYYSSAGGLVSIEIIIYYYKYRAGKGEIEDLIMARR